VSASGAGRQEKALPAAGQRAGGRAAAFAVAVGLFVFALKLMAWRLTGGAALFSDALESLIHPATAAMTLAALWYASRPADLNHPFGHGKIEFFAAVIEGGLIVLAAFLILAHAWTTFLGGPHLAAPFLGIGLDAAASLLNGAFGFFLWRRGQAIRSPALRADGLHLMSDTLTSAGLLAALLGAVFSGALWLDPLLAAAVACYVLVVGFFIIRASIDGLMDAAPDAATTQRIREIVARTAKGALEAHDLRIRSAGQITFLQFHLVVPGQMTVAEAHAICDRIEEALRSDMGAVVATIHVEPEEKAKYHGVVVL